MTIKNEARFFIGWLALITVLILAAILLRGLGEGPRGGLIITATLIAAFVGLCIFVCRPGK